MRQKERGRWSAFYARLPKAMARVLTEHIDKQIARVRPDLFALLQLWRLERDSKPPR
jgi:hypothetical protein